MKKNLLLLAISLLFAISALAQDPAKANDIKRLLELTSSEKQIDGVINNMLMPFREQEKAKIQNEKEKASFEEFSEFLATETRNLTRKLIDEDAIGIYDKRLTHSEIKDIITFYESPAGQKFLEIAPQLSADMMKAMMKKHLPEFQEKIQNKALEMKEQNEHNHNH